MLLIRIRRQASSNLTFGNSLVLGNSTTIMDTSDVFIRMDNNGRITGLDSNAASGAGGVVNTTDNIIELGSFTHTGNFLIHASSYRDAN